MKASETTDHAANWNGNTSGERENARAVFAVNQGGNRSGAPRVRRGAAHHHTASVSSGGCGVNSPAATDAELTKRDIRIVLGIELPFNRSETHLEKKLVAALEAVIEKGVSPSVLYRHKDLYEALCSLGLYFPRDRVAIRERGPMGNLVRNKVMVFESLACFAKDAANCEDMIREFDQQLVTVGHPMMRQTLEAQLTELQRRLEAYSDDYRKIIFTTASEIRKQQCLRMLILDHKTVTLDMLVQRCRTRLKQSGSCRRQG